MTCYFYFVLMPLGSLTCGECNVISLYFICCSVCLVCCMFDSVCELFVETICNILGVVVILLLNVVEVVVAVVRLSVWFISVWSSCHEITEFPDGVYWSAP